MATEALENLARIGQLKVEPRNKIEIDRLISIAKTRLADARVLHLSSEGRFISAYSAGHAAALAALRWHGYRSQAIDFLKNRSGCVIPILFATKPIRFENLPFERRLTL